MRIRIEIDADGRQAEFIRNIQSPPFAMSDLPSVRRRIWAEVLTNHLTELHSEARDWVERDQPLTGAEPTDAG